VTATRRIATGPVLLLVGILALGATDVFFLAMTTGFFGGGYNSPVLRGLVNIGAFAATGLVLDGFLLATLFLMASWLGRGFRLEGNSRIAFASAIAVFVPVAFYVVSHRIHRVFGHVVGINELVQLAGGNLSDAALEAITEAPGSALLIAAALTGTGLAVVLARRLDPWLARRATLLPPGGRGLAGVICGAGLLGAAALAGAGRHSAEILYGLDQKTSGRLLRVLVQVVTDLDFDGYGLLSRPPDPAPFDRERHPFALERPGNGIDDNGVGGDLPVDFEPVQPFPAPEHLADARRPSFLLVFLESFRADVVGLRYGDREVTPVLNALAREGAASDRAFAHSPLTWPSRAALFQGQIAPTPGARTLIDDFHDLGYRVAYFSGQNDLHGNSDTLVGFGRADYFYDARADRERRTSRTALPVSLQVSSAVVLDRVRTYLAETASDPRPLFLYVNLVDNHYPYHHDGLERTLGVDPVGRSEIRPENAQRVYETYLQAVANVDRAVGELVALWNGQTGGGPLLVTADHGQAFYERGMLGHGQAIDEAQSRVPLIVSGIGGVWTEPLGMSDLRGLLLTNLFDEPGRARFELDPQRRVFQFVGPMKRPVLVALRDAAGAAVWRFARGRGEWSDDIASPPPSDDVLKQVLWTWEYWQARSPSLEPSD
jgi:Sulfatase